MGHRRAASKRAVNAYTALVTLGASLGAMAGTYDCNGLTLATRSHDPHLCNRSR